MAPGEWIALVALALSVIVPTLASWRSTIIRGQRIDAMLEAIMVRLGELEESQASHEAADTRRLDRHDEQLEQVREDRHDLDLRLTRLEEHAHGRH